MNNYNIRAAKRHICGLYRGVNGVSFRDFTKIPEYKHDITNRTQEKSEIGVNERKDEPPGASQ